jgi:hypothetical protein
MPAQITVIRVAGEKELSDDEVFQSLERQMRARDVVGGCLLEISVKATEQQVDKAMRVLMERVGEQETARIRQGLPI